MRQFIMYHLTFDFNLIIFRYLLYLYTLIPTPEGGSIMRCDFSYSVCDRNLLKIDPSDILKMNVEMTSVNETIVFERGEKDIDKEN